MLQTVPLLALDWLTVASRGSLLHANLTVLLDTDPLSEPRHQRVISLLESLPRLHIFFPSEDRALIATSDPHNSSDALNDVVIHKWDIARMIELEVRIDGHLLNTQRSDGLIVATPTGSTAYALSANGPILHPEVQGIVMVPVAPQALSNRPIVLPDSVVVEIEITDVRDASAHFDMQSFTELAPGDVVRARRSADVVTLLHPIGYNYFATLRGKLNWHELPHLQTIQR